MTVLSVPCLGSGLWSDIIFLWEEILLGKASELTGLVVESLKWS